MLFKETNKKEKHSFLKHQSRIVAIKCMPILIFFIVLLRFSMCTVVAHL